MYKFSVEDSDLEQIKWNRHTNGYAIKGGGNNKQYAHRLVLERMLDRTLMKGELCDHINRDVTDNRRTNLRLANKSINTINRGIRPDNTTGYVGVSLYWPTEWQVKGWSKRWSARVQRNGLVKSLGYFKTPEEAHQVRQAYIAKLT